MPGLALTRSDFRLLAEARLREAGVLLAAGEYGGTYYLAGYVVETALKACICRQYQGDVYPSKGKARGNPYVHDLPLLVHEAELTAALASAVAADSVFAAYWDVVRDWTEQSRYTLIEETEARGLYAAVADVRNGVLQWLRQYW